VVEARSSLEELLDVPDIVHELGQDHDVNPLVEVDLVGRDVDEGQIGMARARDVDHRLREVALDSASRVEVGRQDAVAAPQFDHAQAGQHGEPVDVLESPVAEARGGVLSSRHIVPKASPLPLLAVIGRVDRVEFVLALPTDHIRDQLGEAHRGWRASGR